MNAISPCGTVPCGSGCPIGSALCPGAPDQDRFGERLAEEFPLLPPQNCVREARVRRQRVSCFGALPKFAWGPDEVFHG